MFKKIFCLVLILKLTQAGFVFVPKFYGQDSAVIVDTDKIYTNPKYAGINYRNEIQLPPPFPLWRRYPSYHMMPPPPPPSPQQILALNNWIKFPNVRKPTNAILPSTPKLKTSTTTTTTAKPTVSSTTTIMPRSTSTSSLLTDAEFPIELLDIAQKKLGLNSREEVPSLTELGQLLGTENPEDTLNYMKQLTTNEQGIALLKAYIESSDYTDNTGDLNNKNDGLEDEEDDDIITDIEKPIKANDEGLVVVTDEDSSDDYETNEDNQKLYNVNPAIVENFEVITETTTPSLGMEISKVYPVYHKSVDVGNEDYLKHNKISKTSKKVTSKEYQPENQIKRFFNNNLKTPVSIKNSIPFNYPVPLRIQTTTAFPANIPVSTSANAPLIHLNTPKILKHYVQQLSHLTKIPYKNIEDFLASKPKLLELATNISRFPISYDRSSPIEAQIISAVQKALEQDDDFKELLNLAATLK